MSLFLRLFLVAGSLGTLVFFVSKIRKSKLKINHSIFWIVFGFLIFFLACVPNSVFLISEWLGFHAPVNMVYLIIIFLLMIKQFTNTLRISKMNEQIAVLTQALAIFIKSETESSCKDSVSNKQDNIDSVKI